jgi:hypothetical protein
MLERADDPGLDRPVVLFQRLERVIGLFWTRAEDVQLEIDDLSSGNVISRRRKDDAKFSLEDRFSRDGRVRSGRRDIPSHWDFDRTIRGLSHIKVRHRSSSRKCGWA